MSTRRGLIALLALGLVTVGLAEPTEEAREFDLTSPELISEGAGIFQIYCANCHGVSAKGNGPVAKLLKVKPSNLTRLSRRGEFPAAETYDVIDGRGDVRGHGYKDMPIWGLAFQTTGRDTNQETEIEARIEALLAYLASIQK